MFWNKKKRLIDSVLKERPNEWKAPEPTVHVSIEVDDPVVPVAMEPEFEDGTHPIHHAPTQTIEDSVQSVETPDHLPQLTPKHVAISSVTDLAHDSTMLEEKVLDSTQPVSPMPPTPPVPSAPPAFPTPPSSGIGAPRRFL